MARTLATQDEVLRRRAEAVAARPRVPDPRKVALATDLDRHRQLQAQKANPQPSQSSEAKGGDPDPEDETVLVSRKIGNPTEDPRAQFKVIRNGPWYQLIHEPSGEQYGKSKRTEAEAWAIFEEGA